MSVDILTQKRLKELLHYDPETGIVLSLITRARCRAGLTVGSPQSNGYLACHIDRNKYLVHRMIWFYMTGIWPEFIDHINHIRTDNRWSNLRNVTRRDNAINCSKFTNNTSGTTGVYWYKRNQIWMTQIHTNGRSVHLGYFSSKDDAIRARKAAERKYGFHSNHGT